MAHKESNSTNSWAARASRMSTCPFRTFKMCWRTPHTLPLLHQKRNLSQTTTAACTSVRAHSSNGELAEDIGWKLWEVFHGTTFLLLLTLPLKNIILSPPPSFFVLQYFSREYYQLSAAPTLHLLNIGLSKLCFCPLLTSRYMILDNSKSSTQSGDLCSTLGS